MLKNKIKFTYYIHGCVTVLLFLTFIVNCNMRDIIIFFTAQTDLNLKLLSSFFSRKFLLKIAEIKPL